MDEAGIYATESPELDRWIQIGLAGGRVISVSFPETPDEEAASSHELLDRIEAYLAGEIDDFADVTVALTVPTDQRGTLEALREIAYGETVTVERLCRRIPTLDADEPAEVELVRDALRANPAPLLIPDHRVEDADGATPPAVAEALRSSEAEAT